MASRVSLVEPTRRLATLGLAGAITSPMRLMLFFAMLNLSLGPAHSAAPILQKTMRLFIAAPVSPEIRDALGASLKRVRAAAGKVPVKWVEPENLHLTLRFFGETPVELVDEIVELTRGACATFSPIRLKVAGLGSFPDFSRPKVIWAGLKDTARLLTLHTVIAEATDGFGSETAAGGTVGSLMQQPHLTLGRVRELSLEKRQRLGEKLDQLEVGEIGIWTVDRVVLMQSELSPEGPSYTELAAIPLEAT